MYSDEKKRSGKSGKKKNHATEAEMNTSKLLEDSYSLIYNENKNLK